MISNAYVQFTVDEVTTAAASLTVRGEKSNNAITYSSPAFNITSRPDTTASVAWSPPGWSVAGVAGINQRTPNLAPVMQEIIDQPGWATGNAVAFTIAGTGVRTARSFDFGSGAPVLHVEYTIGGSSTNQAPTVSAGVDQTVTLPNTATLSGTASDDGLPNPPATITTTWSQVSGPGTTTFANPSARSTTASFTAAGVYVLRLTASDSVLSATDDIQITVGAAPPTNQAPTVNAGVDQTVTLPDNASLVGSTSDDGLPNPPASVTVTWSQVSGPGTTTFANPSARSTTASFTAAGAYVLRLTASDSVLSATDDIQIIVNPAPPVNQAPTVNAGVNQTVTLPDSAALVGTASDDGLPEPPATVTVAWSQVSGPGTTTFGNVNSLSTSASFTTAGVYVLRLTASDTLLSASDDIQITVNPAAPVNQAPTVNAGVDQTVTLPNSAALVGSASDDGLPAPATVTVTWSQVSGPGTATFGNPNALSTSASFTTAGVYVLRLTASDTELTATDDIEITVNPAPPGNQAPTVNAGVDQTVTLPDSVALVGTASDDGLPARRRR